MGSSILASVCGAYIRGGSLLDILFFHRDLDLEYHSEWAFLVCLLGWHCLFSACTTGLFFIPPLGVAVIATLDTIRFDLDIISVNHDPPVRMGVSANLRMAQCVISCDPGLCGIIFDRDILE